MSISDPPPRLPPEPWPGQASVDALARLGHWAAQTPAAPVLVSPDTTLTYADLAARSALLAGALADRGCRPGDRIAILTRDYAEFFTALFGVWQTGAVAVPLNPDLPGADLQALAGLAKAGALLHGGGLGRDLELPVRLGLETLGRREAGAQAPAGPDPATRLAPEALAIILFTSGSTGRPKGVCHTLACISSNAWHASEALGLDPADRIFVNTPPYFTSGIIHFLTLTARGGSLASHPGFLFGEDLLGLMEAGQCTGFGGAPAHLIRVLDPMDQPRPVAIRFWVSSGDHLPTRTIDQFRRLLPGVRLFNMYGLTEVGGRLCILPPDQLEARYGSVGRPIGGNRVTARDPDGHPLAPGQVGELYVSGPLMMQGYLDDPDANGRALTPHGFRTGDFGRIDPDGYVWVSGRKDDIIKRGAEKVSLVQIQQHLLALDGVEDAAVLSAADPLFGQVPVAYVVPRDPEAFQAGRVLRALRKTLPPASIPVRVLAVDRIPRSGAGKVIRRELQQAGAGAGP